MSDRLASRHGAPSLSSARQLASSSQPRRLKRFKPLAMPEDIARMALFLASDEARAITAQEFVVDGGWT